MYFYPTIYCHQIPVNATQWGLEPSPPQEIFHLAQEATSMCPTSLTVISQTRRTSFVLAAEFGLGRVLSFLFSPLGDLAPPLPPLAREILEQGVGLETCVVQMPSGEKKPPSY